MIGELPYDYGLDDCIGNMLDIYRTLDFEVVVEHDHARVIWVQDHSLLAII